MKILSALFALMITTKCLGQTTNPSTSVIFFDDFDNNVNNWTVADNKNVSAKIEGGIYYLTATGRAYGEAQQIKVDTRKDFQIESRIKIVSGEAEHKNYYSMLFWGREVMNSYYFTFAKDGFASVQVCTDKNQSSCTPRKGSLQKTILDPDAFNVYTIKKTDKTYSFFINGTLFYTMPFSPFFGNLMGFGAGRKVTLAIDYLKVSYL